MPDLILEHGEAIETLIGKFVVVEWRSVFLQSIDWNILVPQFNYLIVLVAGDKPYCRTLLPAGRIHGIRLNSAPDEQLHNG